MKTNPKKRKANGKRGSRNAPPTNAFAIGNPGGPGRPKDDPELIEAFRARTPQALETLDKVMSDFKENKLTMKGDPLIPAAAAVKAAEVTLNRGWGAAPQTVKLDVKAAIEHDLKAEVVQSIDRQTRIVAVLERAGQLPQGTTAALEVVLKAETAEPVETKPEG